MSCSRVLVTSNLLSQDALARSQRFREKGLTWMQEKIYVLRASDETEEGEAADK